MKFGICAVALACVGLALADGSAPLGELTDENMVVTNAWQEMVPHIEDLRKEAQTALDEVRVTFRYDVWACDHEIPAGEIATLPSNLRDELVLVYGDWVRNETLAAAMPASRRYVFTVRTMHEPQHSDFTVDWGDGTLTRVRDADWTTGVNYGLNADKNEVYYVFDHTYAANGVYTVRYFGKDWHAISHKLSTSMGSYYEDATGTNNIVCRVFDLNCPVPSHVKNFSNMFVNGKKILSINARYNYPVRFGNNCSTMFSGCANLMDAGYLFYKATASTCASTFSGCSSLRIVRAPKIPKGAVDSIANMYNGCMNVELDIGTVVVYPFENDTVAIENAFRNCAKLTGTVPAQFLWEDTQVRWTPDALYLTNGVVNTAGPFYGCSDAIRAQVPPSWGGNNSDITVPAYTGRRSGCEGAFVSTNAVRAVFDPLVATSLPPDPVGEYDFALKVDPHTLTTLLPETPTPLAGTELVVDSTGSRNYTLFLPNEENVRVGLPFNFFAGRDDMTILRAGNVSMPLDRLPVKASVTTPYGNVVMLELTHLDDGYDWTPHIAVCHYLPTSGNTFSCDGPTIFEGTSLHSVTNAFLIYPTVAGTKRVCLITGATTKPLSGMLYGKTPSGKFNVVTASDLKWTDGGTKTTFTLELHTTHGIGTHDETYSKP